MSRLLPLLLTATLIAFGSCTTPSVIEQPPEYSPRLSQQDIEQIKMLVAQIPNISHSVYRIEANRPDRAVVSTGRWRDLGDKSWWFTVAKRHGKWQRVAPVQFDYLKPDQMIITG
ncbi:MAG: hypothetical protein QOG67_588 [Verrucomicrobiota bacterium]|jgi:hypothetical protein